MRASLPLAGQGPLAPSPAGPAIGRKGFRPFFLLAGAFAVAIVPLWLLVLAGVVAPGPYLDPISWHSHEMVFGFAVAVIAGFLLTAVGNWTQRETLVGGGLLGLCALWLAGRVALFASDALPRFVPAVIDLAFLPVLGVVLARPLIAAKNHRNFVMLAVLAALFLANLTIHLDALGLLPGFRRTGVLIAADVVVLLIVIITGRIVPMFTRNATGVESVRGSPRLDVLAVIAFVAAAALEATMPGEVATRVVLGVAALCTAARAVPWLTPRVARVPLLWILHVGYAWVPVGLALRALGVVPAIATHAFTVGAIGGLTLGMMARVSLGHSGRPLVAGGAVTASFAAITLAALARVAGAFLPPSAYQATLYASGALWTLAFLVFVVVYTPILTAPRSDGKPG